MGWEVKSGFLGGFICYLADREANGARQELARGSHNLLAFLQLRPATHWRVLKKAWSYNPVEVALEL